MDVAQSGRQIRIRTLKGTHFTGTLAQDVGLQVTLTPGANGYRSALAKDMKARLRGLRILSKENLAWEVWLFGNSSFATTDADTEVFLGRWTFTATDAVKATVGGTTDTYFHYYIDGLDVALADTEKLGQINMRLVNRSAAGKSAGAGGEMVIELVIEPTQAR